MNKTSADTSHDCAFYGKWLLEAVRANAILKQLRRRHGTGPAFFRLDVCYTLDLNITAKHLVSNVLNNATVIVPMTSYEAELLALFDHLGFVRTRGSHYVLSLPKAISADIVKASINRLIATEDSQCMLHPHRLLRCKSGFKNLEKGKLEVAVWY